MVWNKLNETFFSLRLCIEKELSIFLITNTSALVPLNKTLIAWYTNKLCVS